MASEFLRCSFVIFYAALGGIVASSWPITGPGPEPGLTLFCTTLAWPWPISALVALFTWPEEALQPGLWPWLAVTNLCMCEMKEEYFPKADLPGKAVPL
jgi:hypothetical protein